MQLLGLGSVVLVVVPVAWTVRLFAHRTPDKLVRRLAAWCGAVVLGCGLVSLFPLPSSWILGSSLGGVVGDAMATGVLAMLSVALKGGFASAAAGLILGTGTAMLLLTACAVPLLAACGQNENGDERTEAGAQTWKFAIEEIEGSVQHRYAVAFKERVEALSEGRIRVDVFPYGQLGTSSQLTELVQLGSVEFSMASPGHLGAVIPGVQLFSLLYSNPELLDLIAGGTAPAAALSFWYFSSSTPGIDGSMSWISGS